VYYSQLNDDHDYDYDDDLYYSQLDDDYDDWYYEGYADDNTGRKLTQRKPLKGLRGR
jgi:hypothetical protein